MRKKEETSVEGTKKSVTEKVLPNEWYVRMGCRTGSGLVLEKKSRSGVERE